MNDWLRDIFQGRPWWMNALLLFSGFIAVYIVLTVVGTAFRGQGQELRPPWDIVVVEE